MTPGLGLREIIRADHARFLALLRGGREQEMRGGERGCVICALFNPRVAPVAWHRVAHWLNQKRVPLLDKLISLSIQFAFRVEIPSRAQIAEGLVLPHPMGIVLGSAKIGRHVTIFQNVTLGARQFDGAYDLTCRPTIGNDVVVGVGAVVLGPVQVGDGAVVAANSLVLNDVPAQTTAIGVPAAVKRRKGTS